LGSIRYYNDSKGTNPESTMKAVNAMVGPFVLIAGGYDKKTSFDELAELTVSLPNFIGLVVLGDTAHKIASSFENAGAGVIRFADNLESAIALAKEMCPDEGNILYSPACSSFDMFKDYEERGRIFKQLVCIQESHV
jgi:UDP-N-acetylmuramoylalanine--D-glutamate ligase